jgi:hypothetical protein
VVGDDESTEQRDAPPPPAGAPDPDPPGDSQSGARGDDGFDLKGIMRQLTAPMIESLDTRLRDQIEAHVDELLDQKLDAALAARFATVDRAIAGLSKSLEDLERRFGGVEPDEP